MEGDRNTARAPARRHGSRSGIALVLVTLATAATLISWQVLAHRPATTRIRDFQVAPYGGDPTPAHWRPGSPFVLHFTLAKDAYALVFLVDAKGQPTLLYPESGLRAFAGGQPVQLPPAGSGEAWLLGDQPGAVWFLLVGSRQPGLELDDVLRRMDAQAEQATQPDVVARELEKLLRETVGEPEVVRIEVLDEPEVSAARTVPGSSLY